MADYGTIQQAKEKIIDLILEFTINNTDEDISNYRRYVDPNTGQIITGTLPDDNTSTILYEKDYRETGFDPTLIEIVDTIVEQCVGFDPDGDVYTINEDALGWHYIPYGNDCTDIPNGEAVISFNGTQGDATHTGCSEPYGSMGCAPAGTGTQEIELILTPEVLSSLSQFISFTQQQTDIDEGLAEDVLDRRIYELFPSQVTKMEEINKFFADYSKLKGDPPAWDIDYNEDGENDHWSTTEADDQYTEDHDTTYAPDDFSGYIPRLNEDAVEGADNQTLQWLRDDLDTFLKDIDTPLDADVEDDLPVYTSQSGGYLKFRGLNQAIIIRSTEGEDVGLQNYTTDGFTITMWVRFLDKVSTGTLFNYGNPLREQNPTGFMLETFHVTDTDRYLRLVLRDQGGYLRDSHVGMPNYDRLNTTADTTDLPAYESNSSYLDSYTKIPVDFSEWFFVVASFDAIDIDEDESFATYTNYFAPDGATNLKNSPEFWRGNVTPGGDSSTPGTWTHQSGYGAKCKVEVISKTDLLRARGFKAQ